MMFWYGQVCTLFLVLQGCHGINRLNTVIYADIGDTVILVCNTLSNNQTTGVTWRKNGKLLSDGRTINHFIVDTDNTAIVGDPLIGEYNLNISHLTTNNFGTYTCEAVIEEQAYERKFILKKDIEELTTNLEEYATIQSTIKSTFAIHTTSATVDITTKRIGPFQKDDNFVQYSIYVVGSISILSLSIACGMCIVHKCKRRQPKSPAHEHENVTQPPIEDLGLAELYLQNEHYDEYESILEIDLENNSQIGVDNLERVTNSSPDLSHSSEHSYLDVVGEDGHIFPYEQMVDIEPTDIHEYETPVDKDIKGLITDILNPEVQLDNKSSNEHALNDSVDIAVELQNDEQMLHDTNTQQHTIS